MIRIITIEREYGSGAGEIARKLAHRLGWKLWDERLTQEIARLSHCEQSAVRRREERSDPLYYRLFKSFALGSWEGSPTAPWAEMLDADSINRFSEQAVQQAADEGNCVIVGRGSQHFLRDRSDTLRFFLYASGKKKSGVLQAKARPNLRRKRWSKPLTVNAQLSSRNISTSNGQTGGFTMPCSIRRLGTKWSFERF